MLYVRMSTEVSTVSVILDTNSSLGTHNSRIPMKTLAKKPLPQQQPKA